jgi:hypothetical protein
VNCRHWSLSLLLLLCLGCAGRTVALKSTDTAPAAQGELRVEKGDNGNTEVQLDVKHLAPAPRIESDAAQYVVWIEPTNGSTPPQNVGALSTDDDLRARLRTVTPFEKFDLFVTAERAGDASRPTGPRVLSAAVR